MTNVDEQRSGTADATQPVPVAGQRNRRRWLPQITRPMSFALAVLFFFGPALAYATGVRAKAIENRPLRSLPGLSAGWSFFADMSAWSIDHLPLRDRAVNANVTLSEKMFGEPPSYGNADTGPVNAPPVQRKQVDTSQTNQDDPRYPRVVQGTDG